MQPARRDTGHAHNSSEGDAFEQELIDQLFGVIANPALHRVGDKLAAAGLALPFGVAFDRGEARTAPAGLAVLVLSSAIQSGRRVMLGYRSARAELTERRFDPYGVAYHRGSWYTIGYCHLRASERLFRLDRIVHIEMTSETFPRKVNFGALEAVSQALASVPRVWQVEVWLATTLAEAQEQTRQPKGCFEEANGGVLLRVDVEDLLWMARLLAGLGVPFIIHRPRELCDVVRQYAGTLASYAERSEV